MITAEKTKISSTNTVFLSSQIFHDKFKRHVDLEVFSDTNAANQNTNNADTTIYVCGSEDDKKGIECYCDDRELTCWKGLKDANIKPILENFILQDVFLMEINITVLQKDKIFPGNENSIKKLSFYDAKIIQIDIQAFDKFISLNYLTLAKNLLKHIDENVLTQQLGSTLLTLDLAFNNLTFHDLSMFKYMVNLEELNLHGNIQRNGKIESKFPESLSNLKKLKLGECGLTDLDEHVFDNLRFYLIIAIINEEIVFRQLETLRLHHNNFVTIPSAISSLSNLVFLGFDGNQIESINKESFVLNTNLEEIMFTESLKLKYVGDCAFCYLPNLKFVDFWHSNNLTYMHENAFGAISVGVAPTLKEFDIEDCNVSVLPENLVNWKLIPKLSLNHNPFACNCSMAWLFNDLLSNNSIYGDKLYSLRDAYHHNKFKLGCLGPPPTTPNHTHPYTIVEIFASCKISTFSNTVWHFFTFAIFMIIFVSLLIYARQSKLAANWYTHMT
uniref:LRRCT domain-containing protein n=1 Tax=Panagrolaimus superbus TaxID=310955 RepID=A0A914XYX1_9BILA